MAREPRPLDVTDIPEILRIAEAVQKSNEPRVLRRDSEDIALLIPLRQVDKKRFRGRSTSADDPLWSIVGMAHSDGPGDVSENVDKYLAEANSTHDA